MRGKIVLVTGASGGLGGAVTRAFLDAGARVAGTARRWKKEEIPAGDFLPLAADLTLPEKVRETVESTLTYFGTLDAVVHLLGGFAGGQSIAGTTLEEWDNMMSLNLRSAFLLIQAALPVLQAKGAGRIIAIGSRAGVELPSGLSAYATSKAALHALVRVAAAENQTTGVSVNAVLPGTIDTPANRAAMPAVDPDNWVRPESIARLILWLASPESADLNGALIPIYGRS
jgi:NAD(P)-dependent dehydrogenase (short-subunit alcohol dehydrogenase family)